MLLQVWMMTPLIIEPVITGTQPPPSTNPTPAKSPQSARFALFPARAFLAFGWIRAGVEKGIDSTWWNGEHLREFLAEQELEMLPFMAPLVDRLVAPTPIVTAIAILIVELALGVMMLTGRKLGTALLGASGLNVIFVLLGVVTPSAFYLVLQITLLLTLAAQAGWFSEARRIAVVVAAGAATIGLAPFIRTIHPAEVIDDPAIMLVTVAALIAATQAFALAEEHLVRHSPTP